MFRKSFSYNSLGGVILDYTVSAYKGIAVFQPVINGVGGNLVAVQASRLSTWLHKRGRPGEMTSRNASDSQASKFCVSPVSTFCTGGVHAKTARVLLLLVSYLLCHSNDSLSELLFFLQN